MGYFKSKLTLFSIKGLGLGQRQRIKLTITNLAKIAEIIARKTIFQYFLNFITKNKTKQKIKRIYGLSEAQMKNYFQKAIKVRQTTGEFLLQMLESRLDNIFYRLGFVSSRNLARQLVTHKHVLIDGKKVNIPSYQLKPGQVVSLDKKALNLPEVKKSLAEKTKLPDWLKKKAAVGQMVRLPKRDEIEGDIDEQLIVEFYSR